MISLLSPAKKLICEGLDDKFGVTEPTFKSDAEYLAKKLKTKSPLGLMRMMGISKDLAQLNHERFQHWVADPSTDEAMQASLMFQGDVYQGLQADGFGKRDMSYAQEHVRILSGLYGVLRPLDQVMPYRLEMGADFKVTAAKKNLYQYWGDKIKDSLSEELQDDSLIINLASNEYSKAARLNKIGCRVISPEFRDFQNGDYKMISFFAKKARGMMTRFAVKNKIKDVEDLKAFDYEGYYFNNKLSKDDKWVFTRDKK
jgi:cytoplasmic iron level regulating protein YaaA (DUF328/UPF0246 family)